MILRRFWSIAAIAALTLSVPPAVVADDDLPSDTVRLDVELPDGRTGRAYLEVGAAAVYLDGGEFNFGDVGGGVDDFRGTNDEWGGGFEVRKGLIFDVTDSTPAWIGSRPRVEYGFSWAQADGHSTGSAPIGTVHTAIDGTVSAPLATNNLDTSDFDHRLWTMDVLFRTDYAIADGDWILSPLVGITGGERHQEWRFVSFTPGLMAPADSRIAEKVDDWFLGPTFGATLTTSPTDGVTFFLGARASVLYSETDLDARHDAFVGMPLLFMVDDDSDQWIWRVTGDIGATKQVGRVTLELRGELDYWDYVAGVDNPTSAPSAPAALDGENSLGWRLLFVVRVPFGS